MMPQFLQTLMGYTAQSAGLVLSGASMIILVEMPIVGQLTTKIPAKYIMAFGWLCLAFGMYYSTLGLDLEISFGAASRLRIVQAFGLGFLFVPINLSAYVGVPAEKGNNVSGLVNFMRNIGSSVGTSMVTTLLARRAQFHACSTGLRQSNGNRLFGRTRPMLAFPNMMHLLANKFSRLCRRRFSLACVLARSIDRSLLRHISFPAGAHYVVRSSLET